MTWDDEEVSSVAPIIAALDSDPGPRQTSVRTRRIHLRASDAAALKDGCCGDKSLIIRHLYHALGFDEHRLFRYRLEHKLVQALVLRHYCPDAVPVTRAARHALDGVALEHALEHEHELGSEPDPGPGSDARQAHLERLCAAEGALIKRALGFGSGERKQIETTAACARAYAQAGSRDRTVCDEAFVLQERVAIEQEYRVHTVEGRVAPELTYRRYGWGISPDEREAPNVFVQQVLDRLPDGFVRGAILAWDVAKTRTGDVGPEGGPADASAGAAAAASTASAVGAGMGRSAGSVDASVSTPDEHRASRFVIIEANLSGYHPVFVPGFQSSGFFQGPWGPALVARLFQFVEQVYGVKVRVDADVPAQAVEHGVYWWAARWHDLFRIAGGVGSLSEVVDRAQVMDGAHGTRRPPDDHECPQDQRAFITLLSRLEHVSRALTSLA